MFYKYNFHYKIYICNKTTDIKSGFPTEFSCVYVYTHLHIERERERILQMYVYNKFKCFTIRMYIMFNKKKKKMLNFYTDMTENNL